MRVHILYYRVTKLLGLIALLGTVVANNLPACVSLACRQIYYPRGAVRNPLTIFTGRSLSHSILLPYERARLAQASTGI